MKKSFSFLLLAGFVFLLSSVHAQNISVGVKGGISIPNLTGGGSEENPINTGYSSISGPDFAVFAEFKVSKLFAIQPMLEYSTQGGKKNGLQAFPTPSEAGLYFTLMGKPTPTYLYGNFKNETKLNYLMLPVLANFGFDLGHSPFRIYASAGPFASLLLKATVTTRDSSMIYEDAAGQQPLPIGKFSFDSSMDIKDQVKNYNAGIEGNIGIAYRFGNSSIFLEGGGNYGFVKLQKDKANGQNNIGAAFVMIGYKFILGSPE